MARLIYNNQFGYLNADPGTGGITITFLSIPDFATLSGGDYIPITLDPGTATTEIVWLTAYTAGATTGTITRAAEDAAHWSAVAHPSGTWSCGPTIYDIANPVNFPAGRIYLTSATAAIAATTNHACTPVTTDFVVGGMTVASSGLTVPVTGKYQINAGVIALPGTGTFGNCYLLIYQNAVDMTETASVVSAGYYVTVTTADCRILTAGDNMTLQFITPPGGTTTILSGGIDPTYLSVNLVSIP